jgi:hypothetical protein
MYLYLNKQVVYFGGSGDLRLLGFAGENWRIASASYATKIIAEQVKDWGSFTNNVGLDPTRGWAKYKVDVADHVQIPVCVSVQFIHHL